MFEWAFVWVAFEWAYMFEWTFVWHFYLSECLSKHLSRCMCLNERLFQHLFRCLCLNEHLSKHLSKQLCLNVQFHWSSKLEILEFKIQNPNFKSEQQRYNIVCNVHSSCSLWLHKMILSLLRVLVGLMNHIYVKKWSPTLHLQRWKVCV